MAATKDPDLLLIERMLAPPPLEDARNSRWFRRAQDASQLLSWVAWAVLLRKVKLIVGSFALIGAIIVLGLVVMIAQLT
jgi:hypothetical protein